MKNDPARDRTGGPGGFSFRRVGKTFGRQVALADLSLAFPAGTHTAIVGPSGCGKTTALRLLAGLEAPSSGEVLLNGTLASDARGVHLPPHRRGLAMVFQDLALWPNLTARQNVGLGLSAGGLRRAEVRSRTDDALDLCGIAQLADRRPGELSGGQQQRVALARAIAVRPAFLLLDEPFSGLDLVLKYQLTADLAALAERCGITLVLVTHDPAEGLALCHRGLVLRDGALVEEGDLAALVRDSGVDLFRVFREHATGAAEPARRYVS